MANWRPGLRWQHASKRPNHTDQPHLLYYVLLKVMRGAKNIVGMKSLKGLVADGWIEGGCFTVLNPYKNIIFSLKSI